MARRASSGLNPALLAGVAIALVVAFFAGRFIIAEKRGETISGTELPMDAVTENANALRGNGYVVKGTLDEKLRWTIDRGQVVSLKVDSGGRSEFLAIEIPADLSAGNIEREQNYAFKVRFRDGGIAVAEQITRL